MYAVIEGGYRYNSLEKINKEIAYIELNTFVQSGSEHWVHDVFFSSPSEQSEAVRNGLFWLDKKSGMAIIADACIDNKLDLCNALNISRTIFSDAFLILKAYQYWGAAAPKHLLGDYSFAIWNPYEHSLFCARDPIGTRPFYFSLTREGFFFSNNINSLRELPNVSQQLNEPYIATSLRYKWYFHPEQTFYQNVQRLLPGHTLLVRLGDIHIEKYWNPATLPPVHYSSDTDYALAFREIFTQVIRDYLRTDLPVGTHLSGGIDSSSVTILAARELKRQGRDNPQVYCWQPALKPSPESGFEYDFINSVCTQERLRPNYLSFTSADCFSLLRRDITTQPNESTLFRESVVQRAASKAGVRLLLSGYGGDEFASDKGSMYYPALLRQGNLARVWHESDGNPLRFILGHAKSLLAHEAHKQLPALRPSYYKPASLHYMHPEFAHHTKLLPEPELLNSIGVLQRQLHRLSMGYITHRLEAWASSAAQYNIIYRYPLLDKRILEFVFSLPPDQFRHGKIGRLLIRNAMKDILPEDVRMNLRKDEPSAKAAMKPALQDTLTQVGRVLSSQSIPSSRAAYLDMPRLVKDLTDNNSKRPQFGQVASALMFLDW